MRMGKTQDLLQVGEQMEIVARGIAASTFDGAIAKDGIVSFTVPADVQRLALEKVWSLGGSVASMNPVRRSLEQMFIEVTSGKEEASKDKA